MAHRRGRALKHEFQRERRIWPVLCLYGPRQCGKSTLLREILFDESECSYRSLDKNAIRAVARRSPEMFLKDVETYPLIIDEAHKAPPLFDELKAIVDEKRIPGRYILSGSVRFSAKIDVHESLTGRTGNLHLDTMTLSETLEGGKFSLKQILNYFKLGGMPGVCFFRNPKIHKDYWTQWLETTLELDLKRFSKGRLESDLAYEIMRAVCALEFPDAPSIANFARVDARRVKTHLDALEDLFIVRKLMPHGLGVGKTLYFPFDCGLATYFEAGQRRLWQTWFLLERINKSRFEGRKPPDLRYYLTQRGSFIDFVIGDVFYLYCDGTTPSRSELMTARALVRKKTDAVVRICCPTDHDKITIEKNISAVSWKLGISSSQKDYYY